MKQPTTALWAARLLRGMVATGLLVVILVVIFRADLDEAWSAGQPADSAIEPLNFVPVIVVLYITVGGLTLTLVSFFQGANEWAQHSLGGVIFVIALTTVAGVRTGPPTVFLAISVLALIFYAVILFFLYHPQTTRWVRARVTAESY